MPLGSFIPTIILSYPQMRLNSTSIHRSLTSCKDVISDAGHRLTLSKARRNKRGVMLGNPMEGGRIHCPVLFFSLSDVVTVLKTQWREKSKEGAAYLSFLDLCP